LLDERLVILLDSPLVLEKVLKPKQSFMREYFLWVLPDRNKKNGQMLHFFGTTYSGYLDDPVVAKIILVTLPNYNFRCSLDLKKNGPLFKKKLSL
jgi:hypothetical protein